MKDRWKAMAYVLVGAASSAFVFLDFLVVAERLGILRALRSDSAIRTDQEPVALYMAGTGVVLALLIGQRSKHAIGCSVATVFVPWLCCGACTPTSYSVSDPFEWLLLPLAQLAFILLGVRTIDWLFRQFGRK
jgi:hypothetical protein